MQLIDGKKVSAYIKENLKAEVASLKEQGTEVCLAVIQVGNDPASTIYVRNKKKGCEFVGIKSLSYELPEETTEEELLHLIDELNADEKVHGILVQLPLPKQINEDHIIKSIHPSKDVDGFHPENIGKMFIGEDTLVSCTPAGVVELLDYYKIDVAGKRCVVVGRSNNVGKPMAMLLTAKNGTVTIAHSKTKDLASVTREADILVAAAGRPRLITAEHVKEGAVVIDIGIHRDEENKMCGDVDFEQVKDKVSAISPVPGGVGPMTIAMLLSNCVKAAKK